MTPATFRQLALELPEVVEWAHYEKPDFRVSGRIFAALGWPDVEWGMVCLKPGEQAVLLREMPEAFRPTSGHWGEGGCTHVRLAAVERGVLRVALRLAWKGRAGRRLLARHGERLVEQMG